MELSGRPGPTAVPAGLRALAGAWRGPTRSGGSAPRGASSRDGDPDQDGAHPRRHV